MTRSWPSHSGPKVASLPEGGGGGSHIHYNISPHPALTQQKRNIGLSTRNSVSCHERNGFEFSYDSFRRTLLFSCIHCSRHTFGQVCYAYRVVFDRDLITPTDRRFSPVGQGRAHVSSRLLHTEPEEALLAGSTLWRTFGGLPLFAMKSLAKID